MYLCEQCVPATRMTEVLAVGGGKGGVGKTCFSVNTAVEIARKGWRVVLVDADLSCSNVETILGIQSEHRLDEFFHQRGVKDLTKVLCDTPYDNLYVIPGATGLIDAANPKYRQKISLIRQLRRLEADLVIVDLDAGARLNTLDFFLITDTNGVVVITPEKTSIDSAFKFLRASLFRRIERFYRSPEVALLLKRNETLNDFLDCIRRSDCFDEAMKDRVCGEIVALARSLRPRIVVNKARNAYEAQIASNILAKYTRQHLRMEPEHFGFLYHDSRVSDSVNAGVPFVVSQPGLKVSDCVSDIANRLGYV